VRLGSRRTLWHIRQRSPADRRLDRLLILPALVVGFLVVVSCGAAETSSLSTLPPIRTTSTTSTSTTVVDDRIRLYTVKGGDNMSRIAASFGVPLQFLIDANADQVADPQNVQPGVILKIPPYVIVDELPTTTTTTTTTEAP
jgi:LysM domain